MDEADTGYFCAIVGKMITEINHYKIYISVRAYHCELRPCLHVYSATSELCCLNKIKDTRSIRYAG